MHWVALQPLPDEAPSDSADPVQGPSDPWLALGWWALQYTPKVAQVDGALVLEVSASERLWGGVKPLLQHIFESKKPVACVRYARGATSLLAVARLGQAPHTEPDALPLQCLAAARPHLVTLENMGCTDWGQLRALPRGGVARRFGAPLLDALDCAYGLKPEVYRWLVLPEVFEAKLELAAQVETAPALMFGASRLLKQLQVWLQLRHRGVLALALGWTMDARRDTATQGELVLRTAQPTTELAHLQRLLAENLARLSLPAPVLYLHLRSLETQALGGQSASLLPDERIQGDPLQHLLERLSARLGPQQVLRCQALADHRPEHMQHWSPALGGAPWLGQGDFSAGRHIAFHGPHHALSPSWLLAQPLKLAVHQQCPLYQGPLTLLAGPQRLEAAWWSEDDCALRDYFIARSEHLGLLWVYRERLGAADTPTDWYLHGVFG